MPVAQRDATRVGIARGLLEAAFQLLPHPRVEGVELLRPVQRHLQDACSMPCHGQGFKGPRGHSDRTERTAAKAHRRPFPAPKAAARPLNRLGPATPPQLRSPIRAIEYIR